jgi:hypothetical protein
MKSKDEAQRILSHSTLEPGQIFRHYKGGLYTVVCICVKEDTLEPMVIYRSNAKGTVWARTFADWSELIPTGQEFPYCVLQPRFAREED